MKFYQKIFLISFCCISNIIFAQKNFDKLILQIDSSLQKYSENFPDEHIIIVSDKNEYLAGETIWASFFINSGNDATFISKTIYAELTAANGKVVEKKMLPVEKGFAHADFAIPGSSSSGVYVLNVYSNWMKNFLNPVSQQNIYITGNDYISLPFLYTFQDDVATQLTILPEGGSFIPGVKANFIIRLTGKNKLPVSDTFAIIENENIVAASGRTINGFAVSEFIFSVGKNYKIQSGTFSQVIIFDKITGLHLQANTAGKSRVFMAIEKSPAYNSDKFLLLGIQHSSICYQSVYSFVEGATTAPIARSKLPNGVIDFFVFDENETIVAFRRIYNPYPISALFHSKPVDNKNEISFSNSLANGMITITAINHAAISTLPTDNFNLLQAEKYLQHEYAFNVPAALPESSLTLIDLLLSQQSTPLLGKKWSLNSPPPLHYMAESGIALRGNVAPYAGSAGDKGYHVELFVRGEDSTRIISRANALPNGDFSVMDLGYKKQAQIFFQGHNPKNKNELLKVQLYPSYFDTLKTSTYSPPPFFKKEPIIKIANPSLAKKLDSLLALDPTYKRLQEVVVKSTRRSKTDSLKQEYLTPMFDDGNAQVIVPDGLHYAGIWHYLRNNVPGLNISGDLMNPSEISFTRNTLTPPVNNTGEEVEFNNPDGIYFFVNEIQVSLDILSSINLEDVSIITVSKQPAAALGAYNGYIAVYTKKGVSSTSRTDKSFSSDKRLGYSIVRNHFIAEDWRPITTSTIIAQIINKDSKPLQLKLSSDQVYKITISGRNEKGKFIIDEKIIK